MAEPPALVLTCEHAVNRIPAEWRSLFRGRRRLLDSHRGYDAGALACARALAARLQAPLLHAEASRLLIDLNRSPHHRALFSEFTRRLPAGDRRRILERYYLPYRDRVEQRLEALITAGRRVLHVAVHSFVPVLDGVPRRADIGLLYDPRRRFEQQLCARWKQNLTRDSDFVVRRNYPYRGTGDGLTRYLRGRFRPGAYAGIELELNQQLLTGSRAASGLTGLLAASLGELIHEPR